MSLDHLVYKFKMKRTEQQLVEQEMAFISQ